MSASTLCRKITKPSERKVEVPCAAKGSLTFIFTFTFAFTFTAPGCLCSPPRAGSHCCVPKGSAALLSTQPGGNFGVSLSCCRAVGCTEVPRLRILSLWCQRWELIFTAVGISRYWGNSAWKGCPALEELPRAGGSPFLDP